MDMRDKSADAARVGILKCGALFRSTSARASSVSRVMLEDTKGRKGRRRRRIAKEKEEEAEAVYITVIVLMGQIASVTNELAVRGRSPWDERHVYYARPCPPFDRIALVKARNWIEC